MKLRWVALVLGMAWGTLHAAPADDIRALMDAGKYGEAYQLGREHVDELGNPGFDFFFGIAALDGGAPGEGVLALERFLVNFADNRSARFHLARGYFILGEDQRARAEFSALLNGAGDEEAVSINRYLDAIRSRESRYTPTAGFYAEFGLGVDSNINAGATTGNVAGLPGFTVSPAGTSAKESDTFYTLMAGVQGTRPIAPGVMVYGGLQGNGRWHFSNQNDIFDQRGVLAQGGITAIQGRNLYRAGIEHNALQVDNQDYLQASSLVGEWAHQLDQFNRLSLNLQYSLLRYDGTTIFLDKAKTLSSPSGAENRDSNLTMLTGAWTHAYAHPLNPVVSLSVSLGEERNQRDRAEFSRDIYGARAAVSIQPTERLSVSGALVYQNSRFKDHFSGYSGFPTRKDDYTSLEFGATYAIDRNWSVRAEGTLVDQRSNIGLYDYERNLFGVKLRYDYK